MYYVYGDLTPFYDRWGKQHTRMLVRCRTYVGALFEAYAHNLAHSHGSAFILKQLISAEDLNP